MQINNLEKNNNIELNNILNENSQKNFLETTLGKTINTAIDIGIRTLLPDFIEDQIINIKNNLLEYGLKDGIKKTIDDTIDLGKSAIGIVTGNFENISQMQNAIKNGGLIDGMSSLLDTVVNKINKAGLINTNIAKTIIQIKEVIINNMESNIEATFQKQYNAVENINKYMDNWKRYFDSKDFNNMEKEFKQIEKQIEKIAPIEKTINEARNIQLIHNLIKNNGQDFNLTQDQLELIKKLK